MHTTSEFMSVLEAVLDFNMQEERIEEIVWEDGSHIVPSEIISLHVLIGYERGRRVHKHTSKQRRKAMRLLKRFLNAEQLRTLRSTRCFIVHADSGRIYRIYPYVGRTFQVEKHGHKLFAIRSFCLHDEKDGGRLPVGDLALAHLLLLSCDESAFIAQANSRERLPACWDSEYMKERRMFREFNQRVSIEDIRA